MRRTDCDNVTQLVLDYLDQLTGDSPEKAVDPRTLLEDDDLSSDERRDLQRLCEHLDRLDRALRRPSGREAAPVAESAAH